MSIHRATIEWRRGDAPFEIASYSRSHRIAFEPSVGIAGNAARENLPQGAPHAPGADPEQMFVASLSSCHMLWFLSLAARKRLLVDGYADEAEGVLSKNAEGRTAMTRVTLRPAVEFAGVLPSPETFAELHHEAHERCFIANSVRTEVIIEPQQTSTGNP
jgi:organic hydroperoxide reductase OsmC/OhrA